MSSCDFNSNCIGIQVRFLVAFESAKRLDYLQQQGLFTESWNNLPAHVCDKISSLTGVKTRNDRPKQVELDHIVKAFP